MNLDELIRETLIQISNGIEAANAELEPTRKRTTEPSPEVLSSASGRM